MNKVVFLAIAFSFSCLSLADEPNVLIIGDSISLGYTPYVVELLKDDARVIHSKGNSQHTGTGLKRVDSWLGDTKWDVIHFNWGLWDLCYRHPESKEQGHRDKVRGTLTTSLGQYEQNLEELVLRLKKTEAVLIWGNTTVVPENEAGRKVGDDLKYNEVAARVMQKHGVSANDLNSLTRSFSPHSFMKPGDVHFKPEGYQRLAAQVAATIRAALPGDNQPVVSRILFGSCIKQNQPMPILGRIAQQKPDVFVFLGDNIYGDTEDMSVLQEKYDLLAADKGFQAIKNSCRMLATWDDHDYGVNDGGADYAKRSESEQVFEQFWFGDEHAACRSYPGVYDAHLFGPPGKRVQIIVLDTRYFRSPLKKGEKRVGGSWVPDEDPLKTVLGDDQWIWLEQQLRKPAEVRIIASSIQFLAEDAGQETWSNLPIQRQRMLDLLTRTKANSVTFISGDRHWSELSAVENILSYPLFDFTSSSLNQDHPRGTPTQNCFRFLPETFHKPNYGVISIDWDSPKVSVKFEIRDIEGATYLSHQQTVN